MSEEIKNQIIVLEPSTRLVQEVLVMIEQSSVAELVRSETPEMAL